MRSVDKIGLLLCCLLSAPSFGQQSSEQKPPAESEKKEPKRVEVKIESLGNIIAVGVNDEVRQLKTENVPEELKEKLLKAISGKLGSKDGKTGITITIIDADGKKEELRLDGIGAQALAIGQELQKLAEQGQLPEAARKALRDATENYLSRIRGGAVFATSSSVSEMDKKLDRILEKLEGLEKRLQALEGKRE